MSELRVQHAEDMEQSKLRFVAEIDELRSFHSEEVMRMRTEQDTNMRDWQAKLASLTKKLEGEKVGGWAVRLG
jgi:hypothetical protein